MSARNLFRQNTPNGVGAPSAADRKDVVTAPMRTTSLVNKGRATGICRRALRSASCALSSLRHAYAGDTKSSPRKKSPDHSGYLVKQGEKFKTWKK